MEKSIAVKKLAKILGKGFGYRLNPNAPDEAERKTAKAKMKGAVEERRRLNEEVDALRKKILAADQEFQTKLAAYQAAKKHADELSCMAHRYRVTVGTSHNAGGFGFFSVKAQGDNWEDVIEKVTNGKE